MTQTSRFLVFFALIFSGISAYSQEEGAAKIRIGIGSFNGYLRDKAEESITAAFTNDGRFVVSKVSDTGSASNVDYVISGDNDTTAMKIYTVYQYNIFSGYSAHPSFGKEVRSVTVTVTNAKTGKREAVRTVSCYPSSSNGGSTNNDENVRFPSYIFPVKCTIENIYDKYVEMRAVGGGKVFKGDVYTVYAEQKEGDYTRKSVLGELEVSDLNGDVIKCKFKGKNSAKQITPAFNAGSNLLVEVNDNFMPHELSITNFYGESNNNAKIRIAIGSFSGDISGEAETMTAFVFRNDGRFSIVSADNADYIVSAKSSLKVKSGVILSNASVSEHLVDFSVTDAKTGADKFKKTCFFKEIEKLPLNAFPVKCKIQALYEKEAELVKIEGGKVTKDDIYIVYEISDGGKKEIGKLKVADQQGDFIKCKIEDGKKEINAAYNSGANLSVEFSTSSWLKSIL